MICCIQFCNCTFGAPFPYNLKFQSSIHDTYWLWNLINELIGLMVEGLVRYFKNFQIGSVVPKIIVPWDLYHPLFRRRACFWHIIPFPWITWLIEGILINEFKFPDPVPYIIYPREPWYSPLSIFWKKKNLMPAPIQ